MCIAQRNHPTAAMPNDDRALAWRVVPPQREAQVAQEPQALWVAELGAEPALVLDDTAPQRHGAEH